jgi:hypothetical protein
MLPKNLDQITENDLQALIANAVAEGKTLDYKRELPGGADKNRIDFLADVSSFSNTAGGDIIFGMDEAQGSATAIVGLTVSDIDETQRQINSVIEAGLEPRIRYVLKVVNCQSGKPVIVLRMERSWNGPHRVIFKGHDKFYGRNSGGKYALEVAELRSAFLLNSSVEERIRAFRIDRVNTLYNNDTPIPFLAGDKVILHCMPLESFAGRPKYDVLQYANGGQYMRIPSFNENAATYRRINLNGVIRYNVTVGEQPTNAYTQIYRNGVIEAVICGLLTWAFQGIKVIPSVAYELRILQCFQSCVRFLNEMGASAPIFVGVTFMARQKKSWVDSGSGSLPSE